MQLLVKLDLINFRTVNNHETRFGRNKFCYFLTKSLEGIKISQNKYFENSKALCLHKFNIFESI